MSSHTKVSSFIVPPVIRSFPKSHEIELLEDSHVDMKCEASGIPVPNVSWYREIEYGWEKLSEGNLRIKNAQLSDSGLYKCGATNFMGSKEKTVKLVVYGRCFVHYNVHIMSAQRALGISSELILFLHVTQRDQS